MLDRVLQAIYKYFTNRLINKNTQTRMSVIYYILIGIVLILIMIIIFITIRFNENKI